MRRLLWIALGATWIGCSLAGALEGCGGGDDASTGGTSDGGNGDGTIGNDDGGTGGEGGTGGDSGGGGLVSNPGEATCGPTLTCDLDAGNGGGRPYCCERTDGGDTCETNGGGCPGSATRLECDEPADCPTNRQECCLTTNTIGPGPDAGITVGNAQCNDRCGRNDLALCKSSADCDDGGTCAMVTCRGGDTFYACNTNNDCK